MKMQMRLFLFRPMTSTNLSNSIIGTITMSNNDSLGMKLVFMGYLIFNCIFVFILSLKILKFMNMQIRYFHHLSLKERAMSKL